MSLVAVLCIFSNILLSESINVVIYATMKHLLNLARNSLLQIMHRQWRETKYSVRVIVRLDDNRRSRCSIH